MGEKSKEIGELFEKYIEKLFREMGYDILGRNLQIKCRRSKHKNKNENQKQSHGIDILAGYYNPMTERHEAIIIECKCQKWVLFSSANVNMWVNELVNNVECSSSSPELEDILCNYTVVGAMLLYKSSDDLYEKDTSTKIIKNIKVPKRKNCSVLYIADDEQLQKWSMVVGTIENLREKSVMKNLSIYYPATKDTDLAYSKCIIPTFFVL